MADQDAVNTCAEALALTERYEQLRAAVLGGHGDGLRFGLGVLAAHGMASWMSTWQSVTHLASSAIRRPADTRPATTLGSAGELVRVLAAMALAHV